MHLPFAQSERSTVGIEWELALVDKDSGDLRQVAQTVLDAVRPEGRDSHPHIMQELLLNTVEVVSGVGRDVPDAAADLERAIDEIRAVTDPLRVELMCAGTHPFAQWSHQKVTDKARYNTLIDRTQWWGRQMLIYGVHVHVGIEDRRKVLPILRAMLTCFAHLQSLSASSPFWGGKDTKYASNRALMFQQLPTAGLPFQFETWDQFEGFAQDQLTTGVVDELSEIRWDVRPSPHLGTLETRICDGVSTFEELAALVALVHCLVVDLDARVATGAPVTTMPPWHVQENKWRAARYGLEAIVILDSESRERLVTDDLTDLLARLQPVAERLHCTDELASVSTIVARGASYQRQRAVAAATDFDLVAVVDSVVRELRESLGR